jgi:choice-of-anchor A domain-containing protein
LLGSAEFAFDLGSATSVVINSDVATANIHANFINGGAAAIAPRVLWNFYAATAIDLGTQFGGSILATGATLTNRNNIEVGVFVNTLNQQGEIHQAAFTGALPSNDVPEPGTLVLVLAALVAGVAAARHRA